MESRKRNKRKYGKSVYQSLAMITQFGINMIVPIVLCSFAGYYLDRWLGTSYIVIILFFVGAMAGFRNIYIFSKKIFGQPPESKKRGISHEEEINSVK
ncbi:MAG: AtpZ/AtpI family protein [Lachnospiraceae bacterium]|nr:AtpZ/AtpI family protein [Lachnospiraceae bacterium]